MVIQPAVFKGLSYEFSFADNFYTENEYENEKELREGSRSKVVTSWQIESPAIAHERINLQQEMLLDLKDFKVLTDQLMILPINLYVDYHYSPEIISGHIQLELINKYVGRAFSQQRQRG